MIGEEGRISVKRGRDNLQKDFTPFFKENEIVRVKFSSLGEEGYAFWRSFEDMAALSRIPLMPVNSNLKSNVQGTLGYWLGYGSRYLLSSICWMAAFLPPLFFSFSSIT